MRRRSLVSTLFRIARTVDTAEAVTSGSPKKAGRRAKNVALGRLLDRAGFWRWLWR